MISNVKYEYFNVSIESERRKDFGNILKYGTIRLVVLALYNINLDFNILQETHHEEVAAF